MNLVIGGSANERGERAVRRRRRQAFRMTTRRLAAILAADVVGFSSMMERNEEGTLARLKALQRELLEPRVSAHHGRVVKTTGDGFLVEFASPLEAVRCALQVQEQLASKGAPEAPEGPLQLRMGITLGDVIIQEDGDIYGEGVNVATRLEQLAEPGGICVSGKVHDEVEGKIAVPMEDRGEYQVKNISRPVRVFAAGTSKGATPAGGTASAAFVRTAPVRMDHERRITAAIRNYLARERISREQFAFKTKLGKSTVDKLLTGLFSERRSRSWRAIPASSSGRCWRAQAPAMQAGPRRRPWPRSRSTGPRSLSCASRT
jgi:class 3 adenylate cyclase